MTTHASDSIKEAVRDRYGGHARTAASCCGPSSSCGTSHGESVAVGYALDELENIPETADLGLGCGNPLALDSIEAGESVLDLGSGGGIDCFLAARRVGPSGRVVGIDMTPEMVLLARRNAEKSDFDNVEFRLGEIEDLPAGEDEFDLVISNCVINLVPDKGKAFAEAFRVLKPGGRISVSDIVTTGPLPANLAESVGAYVACLGGASVLDDYLAAVRQAGFEDVHIASDHGYSMDADEAHEFSSSCCAQGLQLSESEIVATSGLFRSVTVQASKPRHAGS
jgi:arsenite methyltransferase